MITVSLCMIVKNEEDTLARCLNSVSGAVDEIIIVDTGSGDKTKEIAARFTGKIYDFEWTEDFSAARNYSYARATMDYILWLDADDILLPDDAAKLLKLKETLPPDVDAVMMKYNTGFDNEGRATFSYYRERLTRRAAGYIWKEPVHEYLDAHGKRIGSDICVTHSKPRNRQDDVPDGRNLRIYERILAGGKPLTARGVYYYARELRENGRHAEAAARFLEFLDSELGWVEDNICACGELADCLLAENRPRDALHALLRSFSYDLPRAEICCRLGYYYKEQMLFSQAVFWFALALNLDKNYSGWGFRQEDCGGYIPCIELAVCYDALGDRAKAARYNEMAAEYKPESAAVSHNRRYFQERLKLCPTRVGPHEKAANPGFRRGQDAPLL